MKYEQQIFDYADGRMTEIEKEDFENRLNTDSDLRDEYMNFSNLQGKVKGLSDIKLKDSYFATLTVNAKKRIQPKRNFGLIPKTALALSFSVIIIFVLFTTPNNVSNIQVSNTNGQGQNIVSNDILKSDSSQPAELVKNGNVKETELEDVTEADIEDEYHASNNGSSSVEMASKLSDSDVDALIKSVSKIKIIAKR